MSTLLTSALQDCKDCERYEKPYTDLRWLSAKSDPVMKKEILIRDFCLKKKTLVKLEWIIKLIIALYRW